MHPRHPPFTVSEGSAGAAGTPFRLEFNDRSPRLSVYLIEAKTEGIWAGIGTAVPSDATAKASYSTSVPQTDATTTKAIDEIVLPPELRRVRTRICVDFEPGNRDYDTGKKCVDIKN